MAVQRKDLWLVTLTSVGQFEDDPGLRATRVSAGQWRDLADSDGVARALAGPVVDLRR